MKISELQLGENIFCHNNFRFSHSNSPLCSFFFSTYLEQLVDTVQVLYHIYITREQFDDVKNFLFLIEFSLQALVLHYVVICRLTFMSWELKKDLIPLNPENQ